MATLTITCEFSTRPGAKKDYKKSSIYRRNQECKQKLDEYSGSAEVKGSYAGVSAAVKGTWANSHSKSSSTTQEYFEEKESFIEYYDNITLLIRTLKFIFNVEGHIMEHIEESIVQNAHISYSISDLNKEAEKYMENIYGKNKTTIEIPLSLKKNLQIKWVPKSRNDSMPTDAVYGGNTATDGHVYIGRFDNTPGKVNIQNDKIWNFWVEAKGSRTCGEVLTTNGTCDWVEIKRGEEIPKNAIYSGKDQQNDRVWVGKSISGEPGKINCSNNSSKNPTMYNLWCHHSGQSSKAYILTIS